MSGWQRITAKTLEIERCLLWCTDHSVRGVPTGTCMGRIYRYSDGYVSPAGQGMTGDWSFSHWMPLPDAPTTPSTEGQGE